MKRILTVLLSVLFCLNCTIISNAENVELSVDEFYGQVRSLVNRYDEDDGLSSDGSQFPATNRLIVKTTTNDPLQNYFGATDVVEGYDCLHILQYSSEEDADYAYKKFSFEDIEYVEYDFYMELCSDTTKQHISWNSGVAEVDKAIEYIKENNVECGEVRVAVIDSGIYKAHEFFLCDGKCSEECIINCSNGCSSSCSGSRIVDSGYIHKETSVDDNNNDYIVEYPSTEDNLFHGTFVGGVIYDNSMDNIIIVPFRITNNMGTPYSDILHAFDKILEINTNETDKDDIDIVNMSLSKKLDYSNKDCYTLRDRISSSIKNGMVIIAAAGNKNKPTDDFFPGCYTEVITVSATDENNKPAFFSNYGTSVDIAAPGVNITSPTPRTIYDEDKNEDEVCDAYNAYMTDSGTSYAAPLVTAAAAMIKSIDPDITPAEVKRLIKETAYVPDNWDESCDGKNYGTGIVNFYNIVKVMLEPEYSVTPTISINSNNKFEITAPQGVDAQIFYTLDGTVPTLENHLTYTAPLNLRAKKATSVMAACYENGKIISEPAVYVLTTYDEKTVFYKWSGTLTTDADTTNAKWYSHNPDIASVDSAGNIKGVSKGDTLITCSFPTGERIIWKVNVIYSPLQSFFVLFFFGFLWI